MKLNAPNPYVSGKLSHLKRYFDENTIPDYQDKFWSEKRERQKYNWNIECNRKIKKGFSKKSLYAPIRPGY